MKSVILAILIAFMTLLIPACSNNTSSIDITKIKNTMHKTQKSQKDIDAARKSIFPNVK